MPKKETSHPALSPEQRKVAVTGQLVRMREVRIAARYLGHQTTAPEWGEHGIHTLHTACERCGLAYVEKLTMALTVGTLPMVYCPAVHWPMARRGGTGGTTPSFTDRMWLSACAWSARGWRALACLFSII